MTPGSGSPRRCPAQSRPGRMPYAETTSTIEARLVPEKGSAAMAGSSLVERIGVVHPRHLRRQGPHAGAPGEGRGDDLLTGDLHPVPGSLFSPAAGIPASTARTPRLAVDQHQLARLLPLPGAEPVDVDPRAHGASGGVDAVPLRLVRPGRPHFVHQGDHALTEDVEHLQANASARGGLEGNQGGGVERVGVVLPERVGSRQGPQGSQGTARKSRSRRLSRSPSSPGCRDRKARPRRDGPGRSSDPAPAPRTVPRSAATADARLVNATIENDRMHFIEILLFVRAT